jgi:hypothetical protein
MFPQLQGMATQTHQQGGIESESTQTTGTLYNAATAETY